MNELKSMGMNTETLSVAKKHYEDMQMLVAEERIYGPSIQLLVDELLQLRIIRDKVDHPRKGSKDLADAVCGSIYNSIINTARGSREIEVHSYGDIKQERRQKAREQMKKEEESQKQPKYMPQEIENFLSGMGLI
jgi:hypothetical protein